MTNTTDMSKRILVVDDETSVRLTFRYALQAARMSVDECPGGEEALKRVEENDYALIILDHQMPGLTGTEVLAAIRDRGVSTPVIMVSAYGSRAVVDATRELGCAGFLHKPVTPETLRTAAIKALKHAA